MYRKRPLNFFLRLLFSILIFVSQLNIPNVLAIELGEEEAGLITLASNKSVAKIDEEIEISVTTTSELLENIRLVEEENYQAVSYQKTSPTQMKINLQGKHVGQQILQVYSGDDYSNKVTVNIIDTQHEVTNREGIPTNVIEKQNDSLTGEEEEDSESEEEFENNLQDEIEISKQNTIDSEVSKSIGSTISMTNTTPDPLQVTQKAKFKVQVNLDEEDAKEGHTVTLFIDKAHMIDIDSIKTDIQGTPNISTVETTQEEDTIKIYWEYPKTNAHQYILSFEYKVKLGIVPDNEKFSVTGMLVVNEEKKSTEPIYHEFYNETPTLNKRVRNVITGIEVDNGENTAIIEGGLSLPGNPGLLTDNLEELLEVEF